MEKNKCELCNGESGGEPGNENIISDVIVCDYCTALLITFTELKKERE